MIAIGGSLDIEITGFGASGEGVGRVGGVPVFVPFAAVGDVARVRITQAKKAFARGVLEGLVHPAPSRVEPPCPHFSVCGGCVFQHVEYGVQLEAKHERLVQCLRRIGKQEPGQVELWGASGGALRYRNKGTFLLGIVDGRVRAGMYAANTHELVAVGDCLLQKEQVAGALRAVEAYANAHGVPVGPDGLESVTIRSANEGGFGVILNTSLRALPDTEGLAAILGEELPGLAYLCKSGTGDNRLWGEAFLYEEICGMRFRVSAGSFLQINPVATPLIYEKIAEFAGLGRTDTVMDAYCGIGALSLVMARQAKAVYGVEASTVAVEDALLNARINGDITNATFECIDADDAVLEGIDVLVLDPPRKGISQELVQKILAAEDVGRVVYASCEPSTLARDIGLLSGAYETKRIAMFDSFAQTAHLEAVVLLERK